MALLDREGMKMNNLIFDRIGSVVRGPKGNFFRFVTAIARSCFKRLKRKGIALSLLPLFGIPAEAMAHVKWFVEQGASPGAVQFSIAEPAVQTGVMIVMTALLVAINIDRSMMVAPPHTIVKFGERHREDILYLFQLLVGISLLVTAFSGAIIAPHLDHNNGMMLLLRLVEVSAAIMLISNLFVVTAAFFLVVMLVGCSEIFGIITLMEYLHLLGIALFLALMRMPEHYRLAQYRDWALPLLRVFTGVALIMLAFTEKLLNPEMAMRFLSEHNMNFMQQLGIDGFSNYLFVLSAGLAEMLFGLILILGVVTRINIMALACFLIASNSYFFVVGNNNLAITELFGHMPLFAAAIIFIIYGTGDKLKLNGSRMNAEVIPEPVST